MKRWFKSKTIWFNIVTLCVALAGTGLQYINELGLTPAHAGIAGMVLAMGVSLCNTYLRTVTNSPLGKPEK